MSRKLITLLLCLIMSFACFALTSCDDNNGVTTDDKDKDTKKKLDDAYGLVIKGLEFDLSDMGEGSPTSIKLDTLEVYFAEDKDGDIIGGGSGTVKMPMSVEGYNYNTEMKASVYIEDNTFYVYLKQSAMGASQAVTYSYDIEELIDLGLKQSGTSLDQLLAELEESEDIQPLIDKWIEETLIPALGNIEDNLPSDADIEAVKTELKAFLELFISKETEVNKTVISINYDTIKSWHEKLSTYTIDELVDELFGAGSFSAVEDAIPGILALSVKDVVEGFKTTGGDISELIDAIDEALPLMGAPDGATLEGLLAEAGMLEPGATLESVLESDEMADLNVSLFLMSVLGIENPEDLDAAIEDFVTNLKSLTAYGLMGLSSDDVAGIGSAIDEISDYVDFNVVLDKDGKISEINLEVAVKETGITVSSMKIGAKIYENKIITGFELDTIQGVEGSFSVELLKQTRGFYDAKELLEIKNDISKAEKAASASNLLDAICENYGAERADCELIYDDDGELVGAIVDSYYYGAFEVDLDSILGIGIISGTEDEAMVQVALGVEYLDELPEDPEAASNPPMITVGLIVNLKDGHIVK